MSTSQKPKNIASDQDTIVAQATPVGRGSVGIVRLSGPNALKIGSQLGQRNLLARQAHYGPIYDTSEKLIDQGIMLYFKAPHSFTGEDVVEFQGHGGPVIMDLLIRATLSLGARLARPGEFSERAFLNDKIDLTQAEAIADLIDSSSEQAARSALNSLQGQFSKAVEVLNEDLIQLRIYVEAAIDFPEEEVDFLADERIGQQLSDLITGLDNLLQEAQQGVRLQEGMRVVLAGQPNAGKSSLLNALAGADTAIVTPIAGTTRDVLKEEIHLDGIPLHIIDTAGLRESDDPVEQEGIRRAWEAINQADRILLVVDSETEQAVHPQDIWPAFTDKLDSLKRITVVQNKIDLAGKTPELIAENSSSDQPCPIVRLSAKQGQGIDLLRAHLKACIGFSGQQESAFSARRRHVDALEQAQTLIKTGQTQLSNMGAGELLAEDLRLAQLKLNEITGEFSSDDLLGRIFSSFCIGK